MISLLEYLIWRWDLRQQVRLCQRQGHDVTGPHLTMGVWQVYTCTRCPHRFSTTVTIPPRARGKV